MARIAFFAGVNDSRLLESVEFYRQDLQALRDLGHEVIPCVRYAQIPADYDLLYIWWWTKAAWPILRARMLRRPALVTGVFNLQFPEWLDERDYLRRPLWQRALIRYAIRSASGNVFISQHDLAQCREFFDLRQARCIPLCLTSDYLAGPADEAELSILNIAWKHRPNMVRKGVPDLIHAVHLLKQRGCAIRTYLAGREGNGTADLRKLVNDLDLNNEFEFCGEVSREYKLQLLRRCEIYAQPSRYEGFGLATAEAMGCGSAVVTCDVGAVREVVGDAGVYVPPASPEALADALQALIGDPLERLRLQRQARQRIATLFTYEAKLRLLQECLQDFGIDSPGWSIVSSRPAPTRLRSAA